MIIINNNDLSALARSALLEQMPHRKDRHQQSEKQLGWYSQRKDK